ncbi:hypothetical protein BS47DRAFT_1335074 [Hydnum rufescens UP504]|uniref:Uncharacterized protein n=1 Tax=Hydnum rufescens UP504 TaxID=1448309 RepID=A0A9P6E0S9_9AGAM|nr:hypothetical protein BS47DRAFT_1335074 [Hydnum rufescens UP504]
MDSVTTVLEAPDDHPCPAHSHSTSDSAVNYRPAQAPAHTLDVLHPFKAHVS